MTFKQVTKVYTMVIYPYTAIMVNQRHLIVNRVLYAIRYIRQLPLGLFIYSLRYLHTYGFMDKAFPWLVAFVIVQAVLILLSRLPASKWGSFRKATSRDLSAAGFAAPPA